MAVVALLVAAAAFAQPDTHQRLIALGFEVSGSTPQQLAERVRTEREKWGRIILAANIKPE